MDTWPNPKDKKKYLEVRKKTLKAVKRGFKIYLENKKSIKASSTERY